MGQTGANGKVAMAASDECASQPHFRFSDVDNPEFPTREEDPS